MERLNANLGLFEISVNKYDDLLVLNCSDLTVFEKFTSLYESVDKIAVEVNREIEELNQKAKADDDLKTEGVLQYVNVNIEYSKRVLEELNKVFGEGFTDKVFREHYELNPDYVPDEIALADLIEALIPIMEKAYGERIKRSRTKYNSGKRGKHNKSKEELIIEYSEKGGTRG